MKMKFHLVWKFIAKKEKERKGKMEENRREASDHIGVDF